MGRTDFIAGMGNKGIVRTEPAHTAHASTRWSLRQMWSGSCGAFSLLELMLVVTLLAIITAMAIPSILDATKSAHESAAISALRSLSSAEMHYRVRFAKYGSLSDLCSVGSLDDAWADGERNGYVFTSTVPADGSTWSAVADPSYPGVSGDRYFYVDERGTIRFREGGTAVSTDAPVN